MSSTMEEELIALDAAIAKAEWLHELLKDLHVVKKINTDYAYKL
jgi:hypothetical protein